MRDWIRKRLDVYEGRHEKRDEEFAAFVNRAVGAMSDRHTLRLFLGVLAVANSVTWLSVIIFPNDVIHAWSKVTNIDDKIGFAVMSILFGLGMWLTYSLLRLKFPDIENQNFSPDVMATYAYQSHSTKRWWVWLFSVIGGVVNLLAIVFVDLLLNGN